jgi:hypothetical protein
MNYQDIWSKLYYHLARGLVGEYALDGEIVLRKAIRDYGIIRGKALREKHCRAGLKLNLYNLFTYYDLPNDPRFRRNKISLTPQQRLSETLVCPIADLWSQMDGGKSLGRIYCEEFHHAMFQAYAPRVQVNLSQTLTQDGDDHCRFSVYLRPANMDEEERRASFAEGDDANLSSHRHAYLVPDHRSGFGALCARLYYSVFNATRGRFGQPGVEMLKRATKEFADDVFAFLREKASSLGQTLDAQFVRDNCPIDSLESGQLAGVWEDFADLEPEIVFISQFVKVLDELVAH